MKLSEWMDLGHTLIKERTDCYYLASNGRDDEASGCVIGGAFAAVESSSDCRLPDQLYPDPFQNEYIGWMHCYFPWTAQPAYGKLLEAAKGHLDFRHKDESSYAHYLSAVHAAKVCTRMELIPIVRADEPPDFDFTPSKESAEKQQFDNVHGLAPVGS